MHSQLEVNDLSVSYPGSNQLHQVVRNVSFSLNSNEVLGLVGESGSGKSQLLLAILGLQAGNAMVSGLATLNGKNLLGLVHGELQSVRCNDIAMIFQDPMSALNPYLKIGKQLIESLVVLQKLSKRDATQQAVELLEQVRIPEPEQCLKMYPYQLSGGMRQRVMIAMALLRKPKILIADEPTTALDVTVQSEILALLHSLKEKYSLSIVLITHDMSIVAGQCDRVMVMYAGRIVEIATTTQIFNAAKHPYTQGLLRAARSQSGLTDTLYSIPGQPPKAGEELAGCAFYDRCEQHMPCCHNQLPLLTGSDIQQQACHLYTTGASRA